MGSEPGMGWNWITSLAHYCTLHVITEGEYRPQIEEWMRQPENEEVSRNIRFYYNPVSERIRKMCWNQGDWRFYHYYKKWQQKTAEIAREICRKEQIDILHQLNMIGFREPGYLWKVSQETGIPFVWGPIGGLKQFPIAYATGSSFKVRLFLRLKNFLNIWQLKHDKRVDQAFNQASLLVSSIKDSYLAIKKYKGLESVIIPETGTFPHTGKTFYEQRFMKDYLTIMWVGKFDFRKRLDLAIAITALATTANMKIVLKVFGSGNVKQQKEAEALVRRMGVEEIVQWMGNCPNELVTDEMRKADLFLFTSVNEDTSTVVLEAISNHLPVLCFDACGMSSVVTDDIGMKIPLSHPDQSVKDFAERIEYLYKHREVLTQMSENCRRRAEELSWERKAKEMISLYDQVKNKE